MTNGDKFKNEIAKKSNAELAKILMHMSINNSCKYCIYNEKSCPSKCEYGIKAWLDSPCKDEPQNPPTEKTNDEMHLVNNAGDLAVWLKERLPIMVDVDLLAHLIVDGLRGINPPAENNPPADNVNHPAHYNRDGAMECIREMVVVFGYEATINFCKLNAWKYRYRASEKNGAEDMAKSDWYVKMVEELTAEAGYF